MYNYFNKKYRKMSLLFLLGLSFSLYIKYTLSLKLDTYFSDLFFIISIIYIIYGTWQLVLYIGFFDNFLFGVKSLKNLTFQKTNDLIREDFNSTMVKKNSERVIALPLGLGLFFLLMSILAFAII